MPDVNTPNRTSAEIGSPEFAEDRTQVNSLNNKWLFDATAGGYFSEVEKLRAASYESLMESVNLSKKLHQVTLDSMMDRSRYRERWEYSAAYDVANPVSTGIGDNVRAGAVPSNRITDTSGAVAGAGVNATIAADVASLLGPILATAVGNAITAAFAQNFPTPAQNATKS